jgi:hypothetical protein
MQIVGQDSVQTNIRTGFVLFSTQPPLRRDEVNADEAAQMHRIDCF